ncbi:D-alanyl-D-alanine carboxypeptidase/D-alanyl-D-alanine endopeptidase [Algirhabdus cladophorae]|uniref:D-alanyl-D-alanine carboxypeptidase/D-alanyl-D-alanine endopeptidase n=1 Tax=Algirhabdus cladophorae TaxID=3377108 RepID=UPI003B8497F0
MAQKFIYYFSRRALLGLLAAGLASPGLAKAPNSSLRPVARPKAGVKPRRPNADQLVEAAGLTGTAAFAVADVSSGKLLESRGATALMPPASVAKVITGLYALQTLGSEHVFRTSLYTNGVVEGDVLKGDLILVGGGDPVLSSDDLSQLASDLKARGIRGVKGRFLVYGKALPFVERIDDAQPDHVGYNPSVSGMILNFNRVHFEWRRASGRYSLKMDARTRRIQPAVASATMVVADRGAPVYGYRQSGGIDQWSVARGALGGGGARWLPVRNPEVYAGEVFRTIARSHGVLVPKAQVSKTRPAGKVVAQHSSPPLSVIVRDMLKFSTNVTAEAVGMAATVARKGQVSSHKSSAREMSQWAARKYGTKAKFVDHSGLGDSSRVTAQDMVTTLVAAHGSGFGELLKSIPMRNADNKIIPNSPLKVRAKTGTLNFVSGLGGYLTAPGGRTQAFAIFTADVPRRKSIPKSDREKPRGAKTWNGRSKKLQQALLRRWGAVYGS